MPRPVDVDSAIDAGQFHHPEVQAYLDGLTFPECVSRLGEPKMLTTYAESQGKFWQQGTERPYLGDEDPAVMQVIGRCAAFRIRGEPLTEQQLSAVHPDRCPWCDYPLEDLLAACEWATWFQQYLTSDVALWEGKSGSYTRTLSQPGYRNPRWKAWWERTVYEREMEIARIRAL